MIVKKYISLIFLITMSSCANSSFSIPGFDHSQNVIESFTNSPFKKPDYDYIHSYKTYILQVPYIKQNNTPYCGYAALLMVMKYFGTDKDLKHLVRQYPLFSKNGLSGLELINISKNEGFKAVIYKSNRDDLYKHIQDTRPIIVRLKNENTPHYVVVCGWSIDEKIFIMDPLKGLMYCDYADFSTMWRESNNFALIVVKDLVP